MNKEELIKRLEDIEWEDFEVKEAKSEIPKNSWETVSAFSNTAGGGLIFGVKKTGTKYSHLFKKSSSVVLMCLSDVSSFNCIHSAFGTCFCQGSHFVVNIVNGIVLHAKRGVTKSSFSNSAGIPT